MYHRITFLYHNIISHQSFFELKCIRLLSRNFTRFRKMKTKKEGYMEEKAEEEEHQEEQEEDEEEEHYEEEEE